MVRPQPKYKRGDKVWLYIADTTPGVVAGSKWNPEYNEWEYGLKGVLSKWFESELHPREDEAEVATV